MTLVHDNARPKRRNVGRWASGRTQAPELTAAITAIADAGCQATGVKAHESAHREACSMLLDVALVTTGAEYGFCGQCRYDETGQPYLFTLALTNIAWNEETAGVYAQFLSEGLEFRKLDTLYGAVLTSKRIFLTRDATNHPQAGGTPHGHPALERFLGIPILAGEDLIGLIGVANFDDELSDADLLSRAKLIALASVGSFVLTKSTASADMQRRVNRHNRFDLLQRSIGGFAHEFNNDLMCLTIGLPMLARHTSGTVEQAEIWAELEHSVDHMKHEVQSLERFVAMTQGELDLPDFCQLAGQLIELMTLSTCTAQHQGSMTDLMLSVPTTVVMTWLVEAILALQKVAEEGATFPTTLTARVYRGVDLAVDFEITGRFESIGNVEAMTTLSEDCVSLGAAVIFTPPKLTVRIPAHQPPHMDKKPLRRTESGT